MDEHADVGGAGGYRKASAWPVFVALGLAVSEIGVLFGLYPVAVGGLLLFVGSVAGIVHEAGYVARPWRLLGALGGALVVAGVLVVLSQVPPSPPELVAAVDTTDGVVLRGYAVAGAGVVAVAAGLAGRGFADDRR